MRGLRHVQKMNELYNRKKPLVIGAHITFIFLLIRIWIP